MPGDWQVPSDEMYDLINGIDRSKCPVCGGLGMVAIEDKYVPCPRPECEYGDQQRQQLETRMRKISQMPAMYTSAKLTDFESLLPEAKKGKELAYKLAVALAENMMIYPETVIGAAWKWGNEPRNWLAFSGAVGTGKTYLASAIVNHIIRHHGKPSLYVRLHDIVEDVRHTYVQNSDEDTNRVMERYENFAVLLIDEFNLEKVSDHTRQTMENIIRYRAMHNKPTIMTCNVTRDEFIDMWGERIATVVLDKAIWCNMSGYSLRNHAGEVG